MRWFIVQLNRLALAWLRFQFRRDPGYAHGWHCNVAVSALDEGLEHGAANRAASRFMQAAFGVETQ